MKHAFTIAAALAALPAHTAEHPSRIESMGYGCDSVEITAHSTTHATVKYTNCDEENSASGYFDIQDGGIAVNVRIEIGGRGPDECAHLTPSEPFIAIPEVDCAPDGDSVSFLITLPVG